MAANATRAPRISNFSELGVVGRKSGIRAPEVAIRDSFGMEDVDAFFSPEPAPSITTNPFAFEDHDDLSSSPPLSTKMQPKDVPSVLPRLTPAKTNIGSPARRKENEFRASANDSPSRGRNMLYSPAKSLEYDFSAHTRSSKGSKKENAQSVDSLKEKQQLHSLQSETTKNKPLTKGVLSPITLNGFNSPASVRDRTPPMMFDDRVSSPEIDEDDDNDDNDSVSNSIRASPAKARKQEASPRHISEDSESEEEAYRGEAEEEPVKRAKNPTIPRTFQSVEEQSDCEIEPAVRSKVRETAVTKRSVARLTQATQATQHDLSSSDESEVEVELPRSRKAVTKKVRSVKDAVRQKISKRTQGKSKPSKTSVSQAPSSKRKVIEEPSQDGNGDGRYSKRVRMAPLAFWRNERIVYSLCDREGTGSAVPQIKEIIKIDSPQPKPVKIKSSKSSKPVEPVEPVGRVEPPSKVKGVVQDFVTRRNIRQLLAVPEDKIQYGNTLDSAFKITTFEDKGFFASGMMSLGPDGEKNLKSTKHREHACVVVSGTVEVTIEGTVFRITKGGVFFVPRGALFGMRNTGSVEAKVFYAQGTDTLYNTSREDSDN